MMKIKLLDNELQKIIQCMTKVSGMQNKKHYIAVAGLSCSGKSTLINYLQQRLNNENILSKSIALDNWILPAKNRNSKMSVRDRYQYDKIYNDISILLSKGEISILPYESLTRSVSSKEMIISIMETQIIFFDGVIALDHPYINNISTMKIFVEIDEKIRKKRFANFYRLKKFSNEELQKLYCQRMLYENQIVMDSKKFADFIFYGF